MLNLKDPTLFVEKALIGGAWLSAGSGATVAVDNPASGDVIAQIPDCDATDTQAAIAAAAESLRTWRQTTPTERSRLLERWHALMLEHADDLAAIMTAEQGKPLAEARGEVLYGASFIKWFAEEARRTYGMTLPAPSADRRILLTKEPVGVAAIITPWNFPNAMITRKCGPALAAGCTVIIKPSEFTPYSALALGVLAQRAGIPAGVINIVTGLPKAIGATLMASPDVRKVSFTGSTGVGSMLMAQSAPTVKTPQPGTGWQRPFYRVRRCRSRCRCRGGDRLEIPQWRPDLRLRQPSAGAGRHL